LKEIIMIAIFLWIIVGVEIGVIIKGLVDKLNEN